MIAVNTSASGNIASSFSIFSNVCSRKQSGASLRSVIDSGDREFSVTELISSDSADNAAACFADDACRQSAGSDSFRECDFYDLSAETGDYSLRLYDIVLTAADFELCAE